MPLSFADVYGLYREAAPPNQSLSEFSRYANDLSGTNEFDEGQKNGWFGQQLRKADYWANQGLEAIGAPQVAGELAQKAFEYVGADPQLGYDVGKGIPQGLVSMIPMIAAKSPWGMAASAALTGLDAFGESGEVLPAAISAASLPVMGVAGNMASQALARSGLVKPVVETVRALTRGGNPAAGLVEQTFLQGTKDKALNYIASQIGANASGEVMNYASSAIAQETWNPYEGMTLKDWAAQAVVGQVPWMVADIKQNILPKRIQVGQRFIAPDETSSKVPEGDLSIIDDKTSYERQLDLRRAEELVSLDNITDPAAKEARRQQILQDDQIRRSVVRGDIPAAEGGIFEPEFQVLKEWLDRRASDREAQRPVEEQLEIDLTAGQVDKNVVDGDEALARIATEAEMLGQFDKELDVLFGKQEGEDYVQLKERLVKEAIFEGDTPEAAVRNTMVGLRNYLVEKVKPKMQAARAGGPFDWSMARLYKEDPTKGNFFGGQKLADDGTLPKATFETRLMRNVPKGEIEMWKAVAPDLFAGDRVNVKELRERLGEVEAVKVSELSMNNADNNGDLTHYYDLEHTWYDNLNNAEHAAVNNYINGHNTRDELLVKFGDKFVQTADEFVQLQKAVNSKNQPESATARYSVNPWSNDVLTGQTEISPGHKIVWSGDLSVNVPLKSEQDAINLWKKDVLAGKRGRYEPGEMESLSAESISELAQDYRKPKFSSQHYPSSAGENQLAFVRGAVHEYQPGTKLPDGTTSDKVERVMEVWEVQSDWAADQNNRLENSNARILQRDIQDKQRLIDKYQGDNSEGGKQLYQRAVDSIKPLQEQLAKLSELDSPLIKTWEPIALKSALDFARKQGATKLFVTDAESAMMTEGHDQNVVPRYDALPDGDEYSVYDNIESKIVYTGKDKESADKWIRQQPNQEPSQSKGMRAAYDERVPNIMKKLTQDAGKKAVLGKHKMGESPAFRGKSDNTGRLFNLSKVNDRFQLMAARGETTDEGGLAPRFPEDRALTPEESLIELLRLKGFNEREQLAFGNLLFKNLDLLNIPDLQIGFLKNDAAQQQFLGLAQGSDRMMWLNTDPVTGQPSLKDVRDIVTVLSHEGFHIIDSAIQDGYAPREVILANRDLRGWIANNPEVAHQFAREWADTLDPKYRDSTNVYNILNADHAGQPDEIYANLGAIWSLQRMAPIENNMLFALAPQPVRAFVSALSSYAKKIFSSLRNFIKGRTDIQPSFKEMVDTINETFDVTTRSIKEFETSLKDLDTWSAKGTEDLFNMSVKSMLEEGRITGYEAATVAPGNPLYVGPKDEGMFKKSLINIARQGWGLAEQVPVFKRAMSTLFRHAPMMHSFQNKAMAHLFGGRNIDGSVRTNGPEAKMHREVKGDKNLSRLTSDIMEWMQREGATSMKQTEGGQFLFDTEAFLNKNPTWPPFGNSQKKLADTYRALPDGKKKALLHELNSQAQMHKSIAKDNVMAYEDVGISHIKIYLKKALGDEKWPMLDDLARKLSATLDNMSTTDMNTKLVAGKELEVLRGQINNDLAYNTVINMWSGIKQGSRTLQEFYDASPHHMSQMMRGKYLVKAYAKEGNKVVSESPAVLNSLDEVATWRDQMKKEGYTSFSEPVETADRTPFALNDESLVIIDQLEKQREQTIRGLGLEPDLEAMLIDATNISGEIARTRASADITLPSGRKGLVGGERKGNYSYTRDMVATQEMYAQVAARSNASKIMRTQIAFEMTNPELQKYPEDLKRLKRHLDNYMTPDSELSRTLSSLNAKFYLAGNMAGMFTELFQPIMTIFPEVINKGVSGFQALKTLSSVSKDMAVYSGRVLAAKLGIADESQALKLMKNKDEAELLQWMSDQGYRTFGYLDEIMDPHADAAIDLHKLSSTGEPFAPGKKAASKINSFANLMLKAYSSTQRHNTAVAAIVGYRTAKQRMGKNFDKAAAFDEARDFMYATTYAGGRANRPLLQGDTGAIGAMAYSLSSYSLGWLNQLSRYVMHWKGSDYLNLTPDQRTNARNAATSMLGVQLGMAGAMGLPAVGAALKLLEKVTGQNLTGDIYAALGQLMEEDEEEGGGLAQVVMNGAANGLMKNTGLGIDLGQRFGVDSVLGLSSYDGFSGDAVFGPTAGIVSNVLGGLKATINGDVGGAMKQFTPTGLRKAAQLMLNDGEVATSQGSVVETNKWEKAAYAVGFNPQALTALQEYSGLERSNNTETQARTRRDIAEILGAIESNPDDAKRLLAEKVSRDGGFTKARDLARGVANASADKVFPHDIRQGLGKKSGAHLMQIAQALGVALPEANQIARSQYVNNVLSMLGQRPVRPDRDAVMNDQLGAGYSPFR